MSILQSVKWINRHGTACALLLLLLGLCLAAHSLAMGTITLFSDLPRGDWPPRFLRNMAGIQFFDANGWFMLSYLLLFFGALIYMEIRSTPRWAVWSTFAFLSLPICGYFWACLRVGCSFITIVGPIHGA